MGGHDRRGRRRRAGLGDRRACRRRTRHPAAASAARAGAGGRRCACAASRPTSSTSPAARSAATRSSPRRACCAIPDALSTRAAALTEPTAIAIHTVNLVGRATRRPRARHRRRPGRPAHDRGAARRGIDDITVSEPAPLRRERAARGRREPRDRARRSAARADGPPGRRAVHASRSSARATRRAAESALDQLDYAGTLVFVGTGHDMPRINHNRVIVLELTIIGAYNYDIDGLRARARAARVGQAAARPADRSRRRAARRRCSPRCTASPRASCPARSWSDRRSEHERVGRAAAQPRCDQHGSRRCSTTAAAPSCSTSTATCSAGPKATTPARPATR